jgi:hypothetical protein
MKFAPIALFAYNRPEHTWRVVQALRENELAKSSDLFIFADGAKSETDASSVQTVRELIRKLDGFASITLIERERNLGLSNSVIAGVTQLCEGYGRAISVEDDVVTTPDFLSFMNRALERYEREPRIFSVTGHNFPIVVPESYPYDAYCSYRSCSWGWGTWKDRWEKADWSVSDFQDFIGDREKQKRFNLGGDDLTWLLVRTAAGKAEGTWDVVWAYTHSKHDAVAMRAVVSKVYNTGFDGSGTHSRSRRAPFRQAALNSRNSSDYRFPDSVKLDPYFVAEVQRMNHWPLTKKVARFVFDKIGLE